MTAPQPATPGSDSVACGICGFSRSWHEGGGEMIHDFRPAAPSEPPAADSPTPGTDPYADCRAVCGSPAGCFPEPCRIDHPTAPTSVDTEPPALPMSEAHKQALREQVLNARVEFHPEPPAEVWNAACLICGAPVSDHEGRDHTAMDPAAALPAQPPAEAQQDDEQRESVQPRAHRDAAGVLWVPVEVDPVWVRLAARPSADTEKLRARYDEIVAVLWNDGELSDEQARRKAHAVVELLSAALDPR